MHLALAATIGLPKNKQTNKNYTKNQLLGTSSNNNLVESYVQYIYNYLRSGKESAGSNSPLTSRNFVSNPVNLVKLQKFSLLNIRPISSCSQLPWIKVYYSLHFLQPLTHDQ